VHPSPSSNPVTGKAPPAASATPFRRPSLLSCRLRDRLAHGLHLGPSLRFSVMAFILCRNSQHRCAGRIDLAVLITVRSWDAINWPKGKRSWPKGKRSQDIFAVYGKAPRRFRTQLPPITHLLDCAIGMSAWVKKQTYATQRSCPLTPKADI